jgi:hypothetical protein
VSTAGRTIDAPLIAAPDVAEPIAGETATDIPACFRSDGVSRRMQGAML